MFMDLRNKNRQAMFFSTCDGYSQGFFRIFVELHRSKFSDAVPFLQRIEILARRTSITTTRTCRTNALHVPVGWWGFCSLFLVHDRHVSRFYVDVNVFPLPVDSTDFRDRRHADLGRAIGFVEFYRRRRKRSSRGHAWALLLTKTIAMEKLIEQITTDEYNNQ